MILRVAGIGPQWERQNRHRPDRHHFCDGDGPAGAIFMSR